MWQKNRGFNFWLLKVSTLYQQQGKCREHPWKHCRQYRTCCPPHAQPSSLWTPRWRSSWWGWSSMPGPRALGWRWRRGWCRPCMPPSGSSKGRREAESSPRQWPSWKSGGRGDWVGFITSGDWSYRFVVRLLLSLAPPGKDRTNFCHRLPYQYWIIDMISNEGVF